MVWINWGLLLPLLPLLLAPGCESAEQQNHSGFRKVFVLQPAPGPGSGPAGADSALRVSSISARRGAAGQPHAYNVELSASFGGGVRTRRTGSQEPLKLSGYVSAGLTGPELDPLLSHG